MIRSPLMPVLLAATVLTPAALPAAAPADRAATPSRAVSQQARDHGSILAMAPTR